MFAPSKTYSKPNKQTMFPLFRTYCNSPATPVNKAFLILTGGATI